MNQTDMRNWRENFEPEFSWDQKIENRLERKKKELDEPWWYDEK